MPDIKKKVCPLLTITSSEREYSWQECIGHRCAWYIKEHLANTDGVNYIEEGKCAILELASNKD